MPFVKRLTRVGGSNALIIDRPLMQQIDLDPGAEVEVSIENDAIVIRRHRYADDDTVAATGREIMKKRDRLMRRLAK